MTEELIDSRYVDGNYLDNTKTWHIEDSPYKAEIVMRALLRNNIIFERCADVGCGAGLIVEILAKLFPKVEFTGYEISQNVDVFWKDRITGNNLRFSHDNILDFEEKTDLVICLDVFEHVEDYYLFLKKMCKIGDTFVFNIPLDMCVAKLVTSGLRNARHEVGHLHYFNRYTAKETIRDCGYEIIEESLCAAFLRTPPRNIRQAIALPFRLLSLILGKPLSATIFGGMSLLVVAKPLSKEST